jgi:aryl-alcohol dehydrogenase-like predicted oxidoreductase
MEMRNLGGSGLLVSVLGLGCNNFGRRLDKEGTERVVSAALDAGITFFDTADVYGMGESETYLGAALGKRRNDVVVATKFRSPMGDTEYDQGGSRRYIFRAIEASLRRLNTDYVDLYQMHAPDPKTPIEETLRALDDLVRQGKVRYIGSSNFSGWEIADADWTARNQGISRFVSAQNNYSLLDTSVEKGVVPACARFGVGMIPYFPLASGMLTGKYKRGEPAPEGTRLAGSPASGRFINDANFDKVEKLSEFADAQSVSLLHVAIGGLAARPTVASVIAGATKPEQISGNVEAAGWKPSGEAMKELDAIISP